jgi:hypothetical protein
MDGIELFPVEDRAYPSAEEFRTRLADTFDPAEVDGDLTVVTGVTKRTPEDFLRAMLASGFEVKERLGVVYHLRHTREDEEFETYLTFEDGSGVVVFYSNFRKTEEIPRIVKFLESDKKSYRLFLRPVVIQKMMDQLTEAHPGLTVAEFTARRTPGSRESARLRPEEPRVIVYWGRDGRETLRELRTAYGVLTQRVVVDIPGTAKLSLDWRGIFTLIGGAPEVLLSAVEGALAEAGPTVRAFDRSGYQVVTVSTPKREFQIPSSQPSEIRLSRPLQFSEMDQLRAQLEEANFGIINFAAEEGSLFLSADLLAPNGERFRLKATESLVRMLPSESPQLSTFMEFLQFVVNSIDPRAEFVTDGATALG